MLRSKPKSRLLPAGTTSISAERKSSSAMPYFSFRMARMAVFTGSFSASFRGLPPTITSNASPSMTTLAFLSIWVADRWMSRSEMPTTGSSSSSPMTTSTTVPSFFATTPWRASGNVTH